VDTSLTQLLITLRQAAQVPPEAMPEVLSEVERLRSTLLVRMIAGAIHGVASDSCASSLGQPTQLMTVPEAAARLGFRPAYVYDLIRRRRFPAIRSGKHLRVLPRDVDEWVHHHREETLDANVKRSLGSPSPMRRLTPKPKGQGSS
jgi:excisionase family DNA binding protein